MDDGVAPRLRAELGGQPVAQLRCPACAEPCRSSVPQGGDTHQGAGQNAPGSSRSIGACLIADGASGLWLRDTDTTSQPSLANSRAVARPMPRLAPEISAIEDAISAAMGAAMILAAKRGQVRRRLRRSLAEGRKPAMWSSVSSVVPSARSGHGRRGLRSYGSKFACPPRIASDRAVGSCRRRSSCKISGDVSFHFL